MMINLKCFNHDASLPLAIAMNKQVVHLPTIELPPVDYSTHDDVRFNRFVDYRFPININFSFLISLDARGFHLMNSSNVDLNKLFHSNSRFFDIETFRESLWSIGSDWIQ